MERLTFEGNFCDLAQCRDSACRQSGTCTMKEVWKRLKAYEDSGCEPEEVLPKDKADEIALKLMRLADLESLCNYTSLRELAEADKDGRVLILPCKVGDTVYTLEHVVDCDRTHCEIIPRKITGIGGNALNKVWLVSAKSDYEVRISPSEFGILAFLTREEAEKALQEMEGKKDGNETSM